MQLNYTVTEVNIRHFCKDIKASQITIIPFNNANEVWLDCANLLYQKKSLSVIRNRSEFVSVLNSWELMVYLFDHIA